MSILISVGELATTLSSSAPGPRPVILDVRWELNGPPGHKEYLAVHIPGAVYVDLETELSAHGLPTDGRHPVPSPGALQKAARRLALPSIEEYGRALIEDICVPRSRLPEAFDAISEIGRRHGVDVFGFAHAGDGTIHSILAFDRDEPQVSAAADDIFGLAIDLGGTVSGEHGIGVLKRDSLAREIGPESPAVQRAIKDALDPRGILDPGKGIGVSRPFG